MIHHLGVFAFDSPASRRFCEAAFAPLGVVVGYEALGEFWREGQDAPSFSLGAASEAATHGLHIAFEARDRDAVDAFFAAAIGAGGRERHAPRHWPEYRAYCAFVSDPDDNNVEAVHKEG